MAQPLKDIGQIRTWPEAARELNWGCLVDFICDKFPLCVCRPRESMELYNWFTNDASIDFRYILCFSSVHSVDMVSVAAGVA